jgi:hypothetical protein
VEVHHHKYLSWHKRTVLRRNRLAYMLVIVTMPFSVGKLVEVDYANNSELHLPYGLGHPHTDNNKVDTLNCVY